MVTLAEIAERHIGMVERLAALHPEDEATQDLVQRAQAAIDRGDYASADRLLAEAEQSDLAAARMALGLARQAQEAADCWLMSAAAARAERGELSLTQLDYLQAAEHFRAASEILPPGDLATHADYLNRYARALYRYGDERGDNTVLRQAIEIYRRTLHEVPRERGPLQWAMTQNNLGVALWRFGEREGGTARLEEAVATYRATLNTFDATDFDAADAEYYRALAQRDLDRASSTLEARNSGK